MPERPARLVPHPSHPARANSETRSHASLFRISVTRGVASPSDFPVNGPTSAVYSLYTGGSASGMPWGRVSLRGWDGRTQPCWRVQLRDLCDWYPCANAAARRMERCGLPGLAALLHLQRLTSCRDCLDTAGSALTGRHPPAAREDSHLPAPSRVRVHLLSAWFQRGTGDS